MLTRILSFIKWGGILELPVPWTRTVTIARALLALSAGSTYLTTPANVLFTPRDGELAARCADGLAWLAWPCWLPSELIPIGQITAGLLCFLFAVGWFPTATAVPLALALIALPLTSASPDGGDQLAGILGLLLIPVSMTDWRANPWTTDRSTGLLSGRVIIANSALWLIKLQIAVVYFIACLGKFGSEEWANGTALFYWVRNSVFGAPSPLRPAVEWITAQAPLVAALTWGTLVLEMSLAICVFLPTLFRVRVLLPVALVFHLGIWVILGVSSFAIVMWAALLLLVVPIGWWPELRRDSTDSTTREQEICA